MIDLDEMDRIATKAQVALIILELALEELADHI